MLQTMRALIKNRFQIVAVVVAVAALSGCEKKEPAPTAPEQPAAERPTATPAAGTAGATAPPAATGDTKEARVESGDATISSAALSKPEITKFVDRQKASILLCYKRAVQKKPGLTGDLTTEFTISPTGKVLRARVTASTLGDDAVSTCVTERMQRWQFPEPAGGEAVTVTYPFSFLPATR
jgi:TonB family protein